MIIIKPNMAALHPPLTTPAQPDLFRPIYSPLSLTVRQVEVIRLTAQGINENVIAHQLKITDRTVGFHKSRIMNRRGIPNSRAFGLWAVTEGLFSREELEQFSLNCIERAKLYALGRRWEW